MKALFGYASLLVALALLAVVLKQSLSGTNEAVKHQLPAAGNPAGIEPSDGTVRKQAQQVQQQYKQAIEGAMLAPRAMLKGE